MEIHWGALAKPHPGVFLTDVPWYCGPAIASGDCRITLLHTFTLEIEA